MSECHHPPTGIYIVTCPEGHSYYRTLCAACAAGIAGACCHCGRAVWVDFTRE